MTDKPDFTKEELKIVEDSVNERYGHSRKSTALTHENKETQESE